MRRILGAEGQSYRRLEFLLIVLGGVCTFCLTFKLPFYPVFLEADQLIFVYEGWRMLGGDIIYKDFFEFTAPGTQVVYFALLKTFGNHYWVIPGLTVVIAMVSAWLLLRTSREVIQGPLYLLPATLDVFFGFRWFGLDGSHRMISPIFIMGAILAILRWDGKKGLLIAGAMCSLASFFTQQRGVFLLLALVAFLLIKARGQGDSLSRLAKRLAVLLGSFCAFSVALFLPFAISAGFENFISAVAIYPIKFYRYGSPNHVGIYITDMAKALGNTSATGLFALLPTFLYAIILPAVVFFGAAWLLILGRDRDEYPKPMLVALASVFLLVSTTAPNQFRLFQISMPFLVFACWLLAQAVKDRSRQMILTSCAAVFAILLTIGQTVRLQTHWDFQYWETPTGTLAYIPGGQIERYLWLSSQLKPGETFFEVYEPFLYFPLQLKNPTRFGQIWNSDYTRPEHVAEVVKDLELHPPRYILWDNRYDVPAEKRPAGDHTAPLSEFVRREYTPVGPVYMIDKSEIQIWERKN